MSTFTWHVTVFFFLAGVLWSSGGTVRQEVVKRLRFAGAAPYLAWLLAISVLMIPLVALAGDLNFFLRRAPGILLGGPWPSSICPARSRRGRPCPGRRGLRDVCLGWSSRAHTVKIRTPGPPSSAPPRSRAVGVGAWSFAVIGPRSFCALPVSGSCCALPVPNHRAFTAASARCRLTWRRQLRVGPTVVAHEARAAIGAWLPARVLGCPHELLALRVSHGSRTGQNSGR